MSDGEDVIDMERTKRLLDTTQNQRLKDLLTKYEIIDIEVILIKTQSSSKMYRFCRIIISWCNQGCFIFSALCSNVITLQNRLDRDLSACHWCFDRVTSHHCSICYLLFIQVCLSIITLN